MALQGNIETFALPDVLRLLASTSKTGRLRLEGTRGAGSVWVLAGSLVAGDSSTTGVAAPTEVLFELLRFPDGDFVFDQDEEHGTPGEPVDVEAALTEAEAMLAEWRELESVVPSMSAWLSLASELTEASLTIGRDQWRSIATVAGGTSVDGLARALDLGELPILRLVRDLLALGVVEVGDAPADAVEPAAAPAPAVEPEPSFESEVSFEPEPEVFTSIEIDDEPTFTPVEIVEEPLHGGVSAPADEAPAAAEAFPPFEGDDTGLPPLVAFDPLTEPVEPAGLGDGGVEDAGFPAFDSGGLLADEEVAGAPAAAEDPTDAAEIARQLASLSPKAAKAVAAAAKATTDEERDEALAVLDGEDTSLNRDLLLKFLGSVNS